MELMDKGLAALEVSIGGESSTKTSSRKRSVVIRPLTGSVTAEEQPRRDPCPPEAHKGEVEGAAPRTRLRPMKRSAVKPQPGGRTRLDELQEMFREMEEEYLRENGIQRKEEEKPPTEEQEVEDYRQQWESCYGRSFGSFDAETSPGPMYCATGTITPDALLESSLQFFSIKVTELCYSLSWPLQVYGFVAARDSVDHKRNYIFRCTRDSCQTLTKEDPFLRLTGPSRAVLLMDQVVIEVQVKVKGDKESEDKILAFKCFEFHQSCASKDVILTCIPGWRGTLECALAVLPKSIGATVAFRVVDGSWPDQFQGLIVCKTGNVKEGKVVLLDFQGGKLPTESDGSVELSRRLVSVDFPDGKLIFSVEASRNRFLAKGTVELGMKKSLGGTTRMGGMCDLIFCKMEVTVTWSCISAGQD